MNSVTLELPHTLHQQLAKLASLEGVSLNQYIVYALTLQTSQAYTIEQLPQSQVDEQRRLFEQLLAELPTASSAELEQILAAREIVEPESAAEREAILRLQDKIEAKHRTT